MASTSALDTLRTRTVVDCDTMDVEVAKKYGPFQDCTSNQAIAFFELSKPQNAELVKSSMKDAEALLPKFPAISRENLAIEIAMVKLALGIAPLIKGCVHIQTNPYESYSTESTVVNALRIVKLFQHLQPGFDTSRICIKIPSTWEGLMACRTLELAGVRTLATTLFTMEQAILAAEVGCTYIAPYVNQLKVHFEPGFVDPNKLLPLCFDIQHYYRRIKAKTQVLPASLTSTDEILQLAGVDHITIAPGLLEQLAGSASTNSVPSLFDASPVLHDFETSFINDESRYRLAVTRDLDGASEGKLTQAINIFCDMQDKLIELMNTAA
ncbi:hypothetical protein ASPZODRAFT_62478 [Penicilliopsis zonata CBS 506.65]|uniref:Transaldolase n=1 Tax=Penicilliopsis zonata CBS 506.65 TaxID=1073090 RepID=A0A1L9SMF2_9EURO|nr:hypothetical protein ASPZODRAFT_62478 [Penicilliopsis zonata CBS 506.65]OJJ48452.1 hypothetical protein ASPZODRAFT_62478 [Penicilliopsis zonata CBS 506.65]